MKTKNWVFTKFGDRGRNDSKGRIFGGTLGNNSGEGASRGGFLASKNIFQAWRFLEGGIFEEAPVSLSLRERRGGKRRERRGKKPLLLEKAEWHRNNLPRREGEKRSGRVAITWARKRSYYRGTVLTKEKAGRKKKK